MHTPKKTLIKKSITTCCPTHVNVSVYIHIDNLLKSIIWYFCQWPWFSIKGEGGQLKTVEASKNNSGKLELQVFFNRNNQTNLTIFICSTWKPIKPAIKIYPSFFQITNIINFNPQYTQHININQVSYLIKCQF